MKRSRWVLAGSPSSCGPGHKTLKDWSTNPRGRSRAAGGGGDVESDVEGQKEGQGDDDEDAERVIGIGEVTPPPVNIPKRP